MPRMRRSHAPKRNASSAINRAVNTAVNAALYVPRKVVPKGTAQAVGGAAGLLAGRTLGQYYGGPIASLIAGAGGAAAGKQLGRQFSRLTGVGDYSIRGSSSIMNPRTAPAPRVRNADQDVILSRCEYLQDIYSGSAGSPSTFNLQNFFINPGLDTSEGGSFTWITSVAQGFQLYRFEQLVFEFRTTSGDATGANTSLGQVVMAMNYVSTDANYSSKAAMLDSQYAVSGPPSATLLFPVECKRSEQELKFHQIRTGALQSNQNQDIFDMGNFQIATVGVQSNSINLGELWVTYKVRLSKFNTLSKGLLTRTANYRWTGTQATNITSSYPIGQGGTTKILSPSPGNNLLLTFDYTATPQQIIMPPSVSQGQYLFQFVYKNASATTWVPPTISYSNCKVSSAIFSPLATGGQTGGVLNDSLTTPTNAYYDFTIIVQITGPNAYVGVDTGSATLGSTITDMGLLVTELNPIAYNPGT